MKIRLVYPWLALLVPGIAWAHPGHEPNGFGAGLLHPLMGLDHVLAMVAIGWWAAQSRDWRFIYVPALFAAGMLVAASLPADLAVQWANERAVAGTVVVAGLLLMAQRAWRLTPSLIVAAICGALHGAVHALELPASGSGQWWLAGMVVATFGLHLTGAVCARRLPQSGGIVGWGLMGIGSLLVLA